MMYVSEEDQKRLCDRFDAELLADRAAGMGWGEMAKKRGMNKSNLRRLVLKLKRPAAASPAAQASKG